MIDGHIQHNVVNILLEQKGMIEKYVTENAANVFMEQKNILLDCIESTTNDLKSYKEKLVSAKQQLEQDWRRNVAKLTFRKDTAINFLDEKLTDIRENVIALEGFKMNTDENWMTLDVISTRLKTVQRMKEELSILYVTRYDDQHIDLPKEISAGQRNKYIQSGSANYCLKFRITHQVILEPCRICLDICLDYSKYLSNEDRGETEPRRKCGKGQK